MPREKVNARNEEEILPFVKRKLREVTGHEATETLSLSEFSVTFDRKPYMGFVEAIYGGFVLALLVSGWFFIIVGLVIGIVHHLWVRPRTRSWAVMAGERWYLVGCRTAGGVTRIQSLLEVFQTSVEPCLDADEISCHITVGFSSISLVEWFRKLSKGKRRIFLAIAPSSDLAPRVRRRPWLYALGAPRYMMLCLGVSASMEAARPAGNTTAGGGKSTPLRKGGIVPLPAGVPSSPGAADSLTPSSSGLGGRPGPAALLPWQQGEKFWQAWGLKAQEELAEHSGESAGLLAFEIGNTGSYGMSIFLLFLSVPLMIPILFVMIVPGWIYFTYRTVVEWKEATTLGVSRGWMLLNLALVFGLGFVAGACASDRFIFSRILPARRILLARTDKYLSLLYMFPKVFVPRFRRVECFRLSEASVEVVSDHGSVAVVNLRTLQGSHRLTLRRSSLSGLTPHLTEANFGLLASGSSAAGAAFSWSPPRPSVEPALRSYSQTGQTSWSSKDYVVAVLLSVFLGVFGADRLYLGYTVLGLLKFVTFGGLGIWALIDSLFLCFGLIPDAQGRPLRPPWVSE